MVYISLHSFSYIENVHNDFHTDVNMVDNSLHKVLYKSISNKKKEIIFFYSINLHVNRLIDAHIFLHMRHVISPHDTPNIFQHIYVHKQAFLHTVLDKKLF